MKSNLGLASVLFLLATLLLKISGMVRDIVIAYYFGDSYIADAYLAAFIIPNMIILFFTTGMKNALVPSYIEAMTNKREHHHLNQVFSGTIVISLIISLLGAGLAKFYVPLLFPEFKPEAEHIAILITSIYFIAIFFIGMNAVLEALLDAENKFSLSMVSQIIVLMGLIFGAILFADQFSVYALAYGYLAGAVLSLLFKLGLLWKRKIPKVKVKLDLPEIKQFYIVFIPVALTVAVGQINLAVDNVFASYFEEGAVTYVNYAKNLVHFPQAIFGVTIGTIIFPILSKANANNDKELFKRGIEQGLTTMFFILLPAIVGMMLLLPNIVELLYQRGRFGEEATMATSQVGFLYFGSVLFFSLHNVINKGFYTLKKGHLIMMVGGLAILLNAGLNYLFTTFMGYRGIPLASSVMAFFYVGSCFIIFLKLVDGLKLKEIGLEYFKITVATAFMAGAAVGVLHFIESWGSLVQIIIVAVIGAVVYLGCVILLKVETLSIFLNRLKKKKTSPGGS
ncbi:murein biosynthesis integral membrane protein MurJ [Halobacillus salinarum]|uniref:Probable lipid II flippase MurJ n=1 Tax=Halobacillus salinarum TaxID=2932257 RepID=A0ABY4EMM2_9BACI|nr:murein biosynthesis integral membrane protein MurJ [Halobacillus salinarum]UOQ45699.1 murein biosynthesis integral membrane protein MurJ [Halobacillus salinarum]